MTVTWTLPTKYVDGTSLPASEIASSEVAISADNGSTWNVIANVLPNATQTLTRPDLADGDYKIRVLEISVKGVRGVPAISDFKVATPKQPAAPVINSVVVA